MSSASIYPQKYPYSSSVFLGTTKDEINQAQEIKAIKNYNSSKSQEIKKLKYQKQAVSKHASFSDTTLEKKFNEFLDKIFRLGFEPNGKDSVAQESLAYRIDKDIDAIYDSSTTLNEQQKLHGKGLVMNFLRDYILENNYLELAKETSFKDASGEGFTTASVSITGNHTQAVNSDSVQEAKEGSNFYGIIADGVSHSPNPIDIEKCSELEAKGNKSGYRKLGLKNASSYGAYYWSRIISDELMNHINISPFLELSKESQKLDEVAQRTASKLIQNPSFFWNDLLPQLQNELSQEELKSNNFYEIIAKYLQQNEISYEAYPELDEVLKDKNVQEFLAACAPLCNLHFDEAREKFKNEFREPSTSASAATHISYALDMGKKIALVRLGDSPIKAFDKDGNVIIGKNNLFTEDYGNKVDYEATTNTLSGDLAVNLDRTKNLNKEAVINMGEYIHIELLDKKDVEYIVMASDGIAAKSEFTSLAQKSIKTERSLIRKIFSRKSNLPSPKEIINQVLKESNSNDDKSMIVIKKDCTKG